MLVIQHCPLMLSSVILVVKDIEPHMHQMNPLILCPVVTLCCVPTVCTCMICSHPTCHMLTIIEIQHDP